MNIRDAILKAADYIERDPGNFVFREIAVPPECGTPGCAIGWIAHFSGQEFVKDRFPFSPHHKDKFASVFDVSRQLLGIGHDEFTNRIEVFAGLGWTRSATQCAAGLRLYADKYHPAESRAVIPASVMAIFSMSNADLKREFERA